MLMKIVAALVCVAVVSASGASSKPDPTYRFFLTT